MPFSGISVDYQKIQLVVFLKVFYDEMWDLTKQLFCYKTMPDPLQQYG